MTFFSEVKWKMFLLTHDIQQAKLVASCPQGMVKLVELLHETFPYVSKARLKNKVREIAEFTSNRWQVFCILH
jgi:hypothetical protein